MATGLDDDADGSEKPQRQLSDVVQLSVGGVRFETRWQTLVGFDRDRDADNLFSSLFSSCENDDGTPLFIDRNPAYFAVILDFLRSGQLHCPPELSRERLATELDYYMIGRRSSDGDDAAGSGDLVSLRRLLGGMSLPDDAKMAAMFADAESRAVNAVLDANAAGLREIVTALGVGLRQNVRSWRDGGGGGSLCFVPQPTGEITRAVLDDAFARGLVDAPSPHYAQTRLTRRPVDSGPPQAFHVASDAALRLLQTEGPLVLAHIKEQYKLTLTSSDVCVTNIQASNYAEIRWRAQTTCPFNDGHWGRTVFAHQNFHGLLLKWAGKSI